MVQKKKEAFDYSVMSGPGIGIDAAGWPARDPTENVFALVAAQEKRQDDLRNQESSHVRELMLLRAQFYDQLRKAESDRIDAIRAVDVGAVQRAAEVQAQAATALATQVSVSAETLRNQVAAAATAQATSLAAALVPLQEAIADLRRAQYEQQGQKTATVDTTAERRAQGASVGMILGIVIAAIFGALGALIGIASLIFAVTK